MQFSLPNNLPSDAVGPAPNFPGLGPVVSAPEGAFESFLPDSLPAACPLDPGLKPDAAEAAAALTAAFWLPLVSLPLPVAANLTGVVSAAPEELATANEATRSYFPAASISGPASSRESVAGFASIPLPRTFSLPTGKGPEAVNTPAAQSETKGPLRSTLPVVVTDLFGAVRREIPSFDSAQTAILATNEELGTAPMPGPVLGTTSRPHVTGDLALPQKMTPAADFPITSSPSNPFGQAAASVLPDQTQSPIKISPETWTAPSGANLSTADWLAVAATPMSDRPVEGSRHDSESFSTPTDAVSPVGLAKIAGRETGSDNFDQGMPFSDKKEFLNIAGKHNTNGDVGLGITVAKPATNMPDSPSSRSKTTVPVATAPAVSLPIAVSVPTSLSSQTAAPVATLHNTMAAVLAAVESLDRRDGAQARPVDFQFQVGHESLSLRLELKAGTIQATFNTNSTELRHALTHEWQAVMPTTVASGLSVAQPIFSTSTGAGNEFAAGSFLQQGGSQERGQPEPEQAAIFRRSDFGPDTRTEIAPMENSLPPVLSLLNTFA